MHNNKKQTGKRILQVIVLVILIELIIGLISQWQHIGNLFYES